MFPSRTGPRWGLDALNHPRLIVIGAGVSGLAAAAILAKEHPVTVVDRLPVTGGLVAGYEHALAQDLTQRCRADSVEFVLGATALRWSSDRNLLVAGPTEGFVSLPASHLIFAGGTRPSTPAELGMTGDRLAGVVQATGACHLLEAGVRLGHRVVVVGAGTWAHRVGYLVQKQGSHVTAVSPDNNGAPPDFADAWWPGWLPVEVRGSGRVSELFVTNGDQRERIVCDAVILGAWMKPVRNVDGAIFEDDDKAAVTFVQHIVETAAVHEIADHAQVAAAKLLAKL